jgi:glycosyltransferase involved in cell wall biosynthesis
MKFSIVTPSFRNSQWLRLCVASVSDQQGVELEHIVQDSCSDDGTRDWLPHDQRVKAVIEKDSGMYDTANRGYRRARGDILAYLNCDEQYLPGALKAVHDFLKHIWKSKSRSPAASSPTAQENTSAIGTPWCRIRATSGSVSRC